MDVETLQLLKSIAIAEAGLPENAGRWVHGETISELRQDARRFAESIGRGQPRDSRGQFASDRAFNDQIRQAAGYAPATSEPEPIGEAGIGRGASARPRSSAPPTMNSRIRAAAGIRNMATEHLATAMGEDIGEVA
jgi:hypothetical protein